MPRMNGAEMLSSIKQINSEVVTVLLTGYTDFESAMAAVNEGNVFRMLSKPCPPQTLIKVLSDAVDQYDLICSKRILLDKTLRGSVDALAQSLSTVQPLFFGRAQRIRRLANALAEQLNMLDPWRVDIAAVFSQLAYLSLPAHVSKAVYFREQLSPQVKIMLKELPEETLKIVDLIPGLDEVREILKRIDVHPKFEHKDEKGIRLGASIIRFTLDYDYYKDLGHAEALIIKTFESRLENYDQNVVNALNDLLNSNSSNFQMNAIECKNLKEGMILAEDLLLQENMLIASSGADIDRHLLKVIRNYISCYSECPFPEKIKVMIPIA